MMLVPLGLLGQSSSVHSFHLRPLMQRILLAVSVITLLFGSLITFPAYLPWMTFVWIVLALISHAKGRVMWPWLLGCVAVMIVKRPGCAISIWGFVIVVLAVAVWDWWGRPRDGRKSNRKKLRGFAALLLSAVACLWIGSWFDTNTSKNLVADGRPIACLGDSLTDFGYPQELEKLISSPVADFGVNGITTDDGIEMIPEILAVDPQAIVIEQFAALSSTVRYCRRVFGWIPRAAIAKTDCIRISWATNISRGSLKSARLRCSLRERDMRDYRDFGLVQNFFGQPKIFKLKMLAMFLLQFGPRVVIIGEPGNRGGGHCHPLIGQGFD